MYSLYIELVMDKPNNYSLQGQAPYSRNKYVAVILFFCY